MAKMKAHMMDLEDAVLEVSGQAFDNITTDHIDHENLFVQEVIRLLRKANHPLANDSFIEGIAEEYYRSEYLGEMDYRFYNE